MDGSNLPLSDVRVLDLTLARAGPTCVRQLADWGADVIRIEAPAGRGGGSPAQGDDSAAGRAPDGRHGSDFQNLHRNKRSLTLDLKTEEARELFFRLVATADVVVENMRPPVKHRLGVDYQAVRAVNPRIVYGSISGFGQEGPYAERGGVDQIAQGMGGLMSVTGLPGQGPVRVGVPISDLAAGLYLAIGILAALHERSRSGEGQWVRTSLLEAMVAMLDFQAARWTIDGEVAAQEGNHHPTMIPMGCFATADGHVNIAGASSRLWPRLCDAIDRPELVDDPRFAGPDARSVSRSALNTVIGDRLAEEPTGHWVRVLNAAGIPAGEVNRIDQVFADPQVQALAMVDPVSHPELGRLGLIRNPVTMTRTPAIMRAVTPELGEHTASVLTELGLSAGQIDDLRRRGVV